MSGRRTPAQCYGPPVHHRDRWNIPMTIDCANTGTVPLLWGYLSRCPNLSNHHKPETGCAPTWDSSVPANRAVSDLASTGPVFCPIQRVSGLGTPRSSSTRTTSAERPLSHRGGCLRPPNVYLQLSTCFTIMIYRFSCIVAELIWLSRYGLSFSVDYLAAMMGVWRWIQFKGPFEQIRRVVNSVPIPNSNGVLLYLESAVVLNEYVNPICLPSRSVLYSPFALKLARWVTPACILQRKPERYRIERLLRCGRAQRVVFVQFGQFKRFHKQFYCRHRQLEHRST